MKPQFTKGGRGKVAPYQTTHLRIPKELTPYIRRLVDNYKEAIAEGKEREFIDSLSQSVNKNNDVMIKAQELAENIKKARSQKKRINDLVDALLDLIISR
jgi:hypothetical protein